MTPRREEGSFFAIGDPGRAALEVPAGPPPARIGLADAELSTASLPGMRIQAASSRGLLHRVTGTVRQDAFALGHRAAEGAAGHVVAVVCDGVGQFDRSDEAAVLVSGRLAELGAAGVSWPEAFARANDELRKVAGQPGHTDGGGSPEMATTAAAVSVCRQGAEWVGEAAWVGDSTLWHLGSGGRWKLVTGVEADEQDDYHSSAVRALPWGDGACAWCGFRIGGGALFLMTDGVANPLRWSPEVRAALAGWWGRPPGPFTFAAQVGFARKTHMDDRTVVGIWPDRGDEDAGQQDEPRTADPPG